MHVCNCNNFVCITLLSLIIITQNTVSSVLLTLSFVSSGVSSGTNAADVQDNIDRFRCEELDDVQIPAFSNQLAAYQDFCDNLEVLRDSMIASAVSSHTVPSRDWELLGFF